LGAGADGIVEHNLHRIESLQQINRRRRDADADARHFRQRPQIVHQSIVVLQPAVHFPVADHPFLLPNRSVHPNSSRYQALRQNDGHCTRIPRTAQLRRPAKQPENAAKRHGSPRCRPPADSGIMALFLPAAAALSGSQKTSCILYSTKKSAIPTTLA
jgi:hypothetical protein